MSSINFKDLRVDIAKQFLESVSEPDPDYMYITLGKVDSWANDANPPSANTMPDTFNEIWRNMIAAKRITGNDMSLAIKKTVWAANTVYDQYDNLNPNLYEANSIFYIITSENNVYKCLSNNYGTDSIIEPTAINANSVTQTSDGYIWKYMYSLNDIDLLRFTTNSFMPVKSLETDNGSLQWDVQQGATDGAIYNIVVLDGGQNYIDANTITVSIIGDGTGASAYASVNNVSNTINSIVITDYGSSYHQATIAISDTSGGTGATARAILSPKGGHGSDPIYELGAFYALINPRIAGSENGIIPVNNEYRQISILINPFLNATGNISTNTIISQTLDLTVSGGGVDYVEDEIVYQGTGIDSAEFYGTVVTYDSANNLLRLANTFGVPTNKTLTGITSTAYKFVASIDNPQLIPYTGKLFYVDNFKPISRNEDQTEDFKILISFV